MRHLKRWLRFIVPMLMLSTALVLHLQSPWVVEKLRLQVFDVYQNLKPRTYRPIPVRIVDIDDESLKRLGQWPWPRTRIAELIIKAQASGAIVMAVDFIFAEPDRTSPEQVLPLWAPKADISEFFRGLRDVPKHDALLADAVEESHVVTGFLLTQSNNKHFPLSRWEIKIEGPDPRPFLPSFSGAIANLPLIDRNASGSGSFNLVPDRDSVTRRLHLMFRMGGEIFPSFAAEIVRVAQRAPQYVVRSFGAKNDPGFGREAGIQEIKIGDLVVPTDAEGRIWIHYTPFSSERYIPAWKVFENDFEPQALAGNILLLGTTAAGLKDLRATPLNPIAAGVEIHAAIVEQILLGDFLLRPGWAEAAELIYLVGLTLVLIILLPWVRAIGCAVLGSIAAMSAVGLSWYAYDELGWLLDPVLPSLAVLLVYIAGTSINFALTEVERRRVRSAFGHYLAPAVIDQLMADSSRLRLGGEKRETTFLFTDIAGFTSLTERIEPSMLVRLLNEYLDGTCQIIFNHGGTIDKIVGDALHVMFNAPSDQPDHAERAVRCALELDEHCRSYALDQAKQGIPLGETRIGINTGITVVGNFGGMVRFDYTAHGDAINTAARLESANRYLGTSICVSETTCNSCPQDDFSFRPIGRLLLKGKSEGLLVFEPLQVDHANGGKLGSYLRAYNLMEKSDARASKVFRELSIEYPDDRLISFHARRLEEGVNGATIVLTEK